MFYFKPTSILSSLEFLISNLNPLAIFHFILKYAYIVYCSLTVVFRKLATLNTYSCLGDTFWYSCESLKSLCSIVNILFTTSDIVHSRFFNADLRNVLICSFLWHILVPPVKCFMCYHLGHISFSFISFWMINL